MKKNIASFAYILIIILELLNLDYSKLNTIDIGKSEYLSLALVAVSLIALIYNIRSKNDHEA